MSGSQWWGFTATLSPVERYLPDLATLDDEDPAAGRGFETGLERQRRDGLRRRLARTLDRAAGDDEPPTAHEDLVSHLEPGETAELRISVTREPDAGAHAGDR